MSIISQETWKRLIEIMKTDDFELSEPLVQKVIREGDKEDLKKLYAITTLTHIICQ